MFCPACISTTTVVIGGFISTGGVAALLAKLKSSFGNKDKTFRRLISVAKFRRNHE
jgi:hypothetical protein